MRLATEADLRGGCAPRRRLLPMLLEPPDGLIVDDRGVGEQGERTDELGIGRVAAARGEDRLRCMLMALRCAALLVVV
jgi:hypothetical protein